MLIDRKSAALQWGSPGSHEGSGEGSLDLELSGIDRDWFGRPFGVPAAFGLAIDPTSLWFVAARRKSATIHPQARPGEFTPGLWQYDVAEFFLSHPTSGRYLEFNLAPNGAWWSAEFTAPRVSDGAIDTGIPGVKTYSEVAPDGCWLAAASIPLDVLESRFAFGPTTRMNVTFIVDSPDQKFLTYHQAPAGDPDFHQPALFRQVTIYEGDESQP